jgi:multiple antibiotic resistance protein
MRRIFSTSPAITPRSAQKVLERKIAIYGFVLLAVSLVFGIEILSFFGISLVVVQVAAGGRD